MLIVVLLVALGIIVLCGMNNKYGDGYFPGGLIVGGALLIALLVFPLERMGIRSNIEQYYATKETIERARSNKNISDMELAALQHKVVEINSWLKRKQYWNKNVWIEVYIPDEVDTLQPLE